MRFRLLGQLIPLFLGAVAAPAVAQKVEPGATVVNADRISGRNSIETIAEGNAEFQRDDTTIKADRLIYRHLEDEAEADGNVTMTRDVDRISGPHLKLKVQDNLGTFDSPSFVIKRAPALVSDTSVPREPATGSGEAERMDFEGEGLYRLTRGKFSTCSPHRDWYVTADDIALDYNREIGEADDAKVVFMDTPIFYWP